MSENVENKQKAEHNIRSNFSLLLIFCVQGLTFLPFLISWLVNILFYDAFYWEDVFYSLVAPYLYILILSFFILLFATIVRSKWWTAIPLSYILFGFPIFSWLITFLAGQIVRLLYIPTVNDLLETKRILKMRVKPRKKYLPVYQEFLAVEKIEKPYYFSLWQTTIASFFGGVIGGGLLLSINYKRLGDNTKFAIGLMFSFLLHFILIFFIYGLLEWNDNIKFYYLIPFLLFIPILCNLIYKESLLENLEHQIADETIIKAPWWSVVGVTLISFIYLLFILVPIWQIYRDIENSLHSLFM